MNSELQRWMCFHKRNPDVYPELIKLAEKVKKIKKMYSVYALFHVIRFNRDINTNGDKFKINNNLIPFYSKLLSTERPEFDGFFKKRHGAHIDNIDGQELLNFHKSVRYRGGDCG